ncbi:MAG: chemotaxis response regulator protein-glutamate methylesterase [Burkholderiaceae bacterium]
MNDVTVLVVDDSALVRSLLKSLLDQQPGIRCVGVAADAGEARGLIRQLDPDVLTLDVEMPGMNGLDFLRQLMRSRPMPVVMISSLTERGAETTLAALELGAVDFVAKPKFELSHGIAVSAREIAAKIRMAARARVTPEARPAPLLPARRGSEQSEASEIAAPGHGAGAPSHGAASLRSSAVETAASAPASGARAAYAAGSARRSAGMHKPAASAAPAPAAMSNPMSGAAGGSGIAHGRRTTAGARSARITHDTVIAIGASTGGTEAIRELLCRLPANCPPVVMVQHMPAAFTGSFAKRLDQCSALKVIEAEHGQALSHGVAYLAPGHSHLRVRNQGGRLTTQLGDDAEISGHRPSVDAMFESLWPIAGRVIGVILTGMGRDGARAMTTLHDKGAFTYGQDESSCVVYGMPRAAAQAGALDIVMSPTQIGEALAALMR